MMWEEENTIIFINHCIRSMCLHHIYFTLELCCKAFNGYIISKSRSMPFSILIYR
uniref:Uncharacterized protein n=1 Tax=Rhizophora mucronata TaxID=61149 RepID=A0A2P2R290_RHIMU